MRSEHPAVRSGRVCPTVTGSPVRLRQRISAMADQCKTLGQTDAKGPHMCVRFQSQQPRRDGVAMHEECDCMLVLDSRAILES